MQEKRDLMKRRELLKKSAAFGLMAVVSPVAFPKVHSGAGLMGGAGDTAPSNPLKPPAEGSIPVAFLISEGAVIIDFCGPWEVFQDANLPTRKDSLFNTYTVAETTKPIRASGGMQITPDYSYETAPLPKVLVIPAQSANSEATLEWIRKVTKTSDVTMSVCNGAFILAKTGLLSGKSATIHHASYGALTMKFRDIHVKRGARFVEDGNLATSGGLSSGIDLALRVVERYFGRDVAKQTAFDMEYQGQGWMSPDSNAVYAQKYVSTPEHPLCAVCGMAVDPNRNPMSLYKGVAYYFCNSGCKQQFDAAPDEFASTAKKI
jgi:putative intracellular protease/amidase/YHS domain-containing protein